MTKRLTLLSLALSTCLLVLGLGATPAGPGCSRQGLNGTPRRVRE